MKELQIRTFTLKYKNVLPTGIVYIFVSFPVGSGMWTACQSTVLDAVIYTWVRYVHQGKLSQKSDLLNLSIYYPVVNTWMYFF